jgi:hypothetical protein
MNKINLIYIKFMYYALNNSSLHLAAAFLVIGLILIMLKTILKIKIKLIQHHVFQFMELDNLKCLCYNDESTELWFSGSIESIF